MVKIIHYCWFGGSSKSEHMIHCIKSWKKNLNGYKIMEWNENNFNIALFPYVDSAYKYKKFAFVSDYVRFYALNKYGGIYLDTDVEIIKDLNDFLSKNENFLGLESPGIVGSAVIGSCKDNDVIQKILNLYNKKVFDYETSPQILSSELKKYGDLNPNSEVGGFKIYSEDFFYPFPFNGDFAPSCITNNTYAIHWWNHSWKSESKIVRLVKVLKIYSLLNRILGKMGILNKIKKYF